MEATVITDLRVIGCGEKSQPIIEQVKAFEFEGLVTEVITETNNLTSEVDNKMVIVLAPEYFEGLDKLLKKFYQSGVLTILIAANNFGLSSYVCDSHTTVPLEQFAEVVKILVQALFIQGTINYDFNDLSMTLRNTGNFYTYKAEDRFAEAVDSLSRQSDIFEGAENGTLLIMVNRDKTHVRVEDIDLLSKYLGTLPENINMRWALYNDDTLPADTVRISIIIAGKNCRINRVDK
ncbi:MAG: hypothetical protein K2H47_10200 [Muribaculaceae bacterium]|nr:hypothetical protein [Muribaculaceae bacterium]